MQGAAAGIIEKIAAGMGKVRAWIVVREHEDSGSLSQDFLPRRTDCFAFFVDAFIKMKVCCLALLE